MAKTILELMLQEKAIKYNKPYYVIWEIYMSQFKKLREEMATYNFETIKLPNWGKYIASGTKVRKYKAKLNNGEGNTQDSKNSSL
jgi:hypothetical protein